MKRILAALAVAVATPALAYCAQGYLVNTEYSYAGGRPVLVCTYRLGSATAQMVTYSTSCPYSYPVCQ